MTLPFASFPFPPYFSERGAVLHFFPPFPTSFWDYGPVYEWAAYRTTVGRQWCSLGVGGWGGVDTVTLPHRVTPALVTPLVKSSVSCFKSFSQCNIINLKSVTHSFSVVCLRLHVTKKSSHAVFRSHSTEIIRYHKIITSDEKAPNKWIRSVVERGTCDLFQID